MDSSEAYRWLGTVRISTLKRKSIIWQKPNAEEEVPWRPNGKHRYQHSTKVVKTQEQTIHRGNTPQDLVISIHTYAEQMKHSVVKMANSELKG